MTTIVYKQGILAADTMVTEVPFNEKGIHLKDAKSQATKIFSPKELTFEGEPILAMGFSGNSNIIYFLESRGFDLGITPTYATHLDPEDLEEAREIKQTFQTYVEIDGRYKDLGTIDLALFFNIYRGGAAYFNDHTNQKI